MADSKGDKGAKGAKPGKGDKPAAKGPKPEAASSLRDAKAKSRREGGAEVAAAGPARSRPRRRTMSRG
jgi:hypothetical protein